MAKGGGWPVTFAERLPAATAVAVLSGVLLQFSLPSMAMPWLAYVGLAPLLLYCRRLNGLRCLWLGWACGLGFYLPLLYWVVFVMEQYGGLPRFASVLVTLLLACYLACYTALFATLASFVARRQPGWYWVAAPLLWVGVEVLRAQAIFGGFPWGELAYSQVPWPVMIQSADVFGTAGLNFLLVTINVAVAFVCETWWRGAPGTRLRACALQPVVLVAGLLVLLNLAYGWMQWSAQAPAAARSEINAAGRDTEVLRLGILQGSISQGMKWDAAYRNATLDIYEDLSRQALAAMPQLIVLPETALPFDFAAATPMRRRVLEWVRQTGTSTLVGAPTLESSSAAAWARGGSGDQRVFNSAYLLSPQGEVVGRYDKQHLVPFGEYMPLAWLFSFAKNLTAGVGEFTPGSGAGLMSIQGRRFAVLICFEIIFPELARQAVREGAEFFLNLTNDAWFGTTSAPYQHWAMGSLRAVETRRPIARAANTGISGWIDRRGVLHAGAGLFERTVVTTTITPRRTGLTTYVRGGFLFGWLCAAAALLFLAAASRAAVRRRA